MKIFLIIFLCGFTTACTKKTQENKSVSPFDFSQHYRIDTQFDQETSNLKIVVALDKQIHAYADGETIGRPVRLSITKKNGWDKISNPIIPTGKIKKLKVLGESHVLEGTFTLEQKVIKGEGPGEAILYLQVCSEDACDQPRTHTLVFGQP